MANNLTDVNNPDIIKEAEPSGIDGQPLRGDAQ